MMETTTHFTVIIILHYMKPSMALNSFRLFVVIGRVTPWSRLYWTNKLLIHGLPHISDNSRKSALGQKRSILLNSVATGRAQILVSHTLCCWGLTACMIRSQAGSDSQFHTPSIKIRLSVGELWLWPQLWCHAIKQSDLRPSLKGR